MGSVYECKSKGTLVDYHHATFLDTHSIWVGKGDYKKICTSWPGLSYDLVLKYLTKKQLTILGHLQKPQKAYDPCRKSNYNQTQNQR